MDINIYNLLLKQKEIIQLIILGNCATFRKEIIKIFTRNYTK